MTTAALPLPFPTWRQFVWRHAEWWAVSLSVAAWLFLFVTAAIQFSGSPLFSSVHAAHTLRIPGFFPIFSALNVWLQMAIHWLLMIAAMMFPSLTGQLRFVAARNLWPRRNRALALFLSGYAALWLLFGLFAEPTLALPQSLSPKLGGVAAPVCFLLAALWQLSPQKRRSLVACHFTAPLTPTGRRGDFDCLRHGLRIASGCCVSCWALMLACAASGHSLPATLVVTVIVWFERVGPRPRQLYPAVSLSAVALVYLLVTLA